MSIFAHTTRMCRLAFATRSPFLCLLPSSSGRCSRYLVWRRCYLRRKQGRNSPNGLKPRASWFTTPTQPQYLNIRKPAISSGSCGSSGVRVSRLIGRLHGYEEDSMPSGGIFQSSSTKSRHQRKQRMSRNRRCLWTLVCLWLVRWHLRPLRLVSSVRSFQRQRLPQLRHCHCVLG